MSSLPQADPRITDIERPPRAARAVYLYCLVRSTRRPPAAGVPPGLPGAERPAPVKLDDAVWLVTASVPLERYGARPLEASMRDLDWVASVALAHEAVVEFFARAPGAAVIPMKLFTMFSTDARAAAAMRRRRTALDRVFDRIDGCEEWGVRVIKAEAPAPPARPSRPPTGTAFLAARKQVRDERQALARAAADAADALYDALGSIARARRRRSDAPAGAPPPLLDAAFLVPRRRRARFDAAAERAKTALARVGGRVTVTGPWPAYNFVSAPSRGEQP